MNGDGNLEIIVATRDNKIEVLQSRKAGKEGEGFLQAYSLKSLDPYRKSLGVPRANIKIMAMAAGYIDPPLTELYKKPRKG